jgi:hypothetical protein
MDTESRLAELAAEVAAAPTPRAALRRLGELREELDAFERRQVARALVEGASFAAIARDLGLSRQAVHRRFRSLATEVAPLQTAPDVRRVLQAAREEAAALGAAGVESEHVVLAILRVGDLPAAEVLQEAGVSLSRARMQVEGSTPRARLFRREPDPNGLIALLERPARAARARGSGQIEVEDVLVGALEDPSGGAARTVRALGADPEEVRERLATSSRSAGS